jgi:4-aminobutyrate aminotransferase
MNWPPGAHASTFGGNPVSVAAALVTLELLESGLIANAARVGERLLGRLREWPRRFPAVGEVRGLGLMIGIEFVVSQATRERNPELRDRIVQRCFERGLLVLGAGPNSIRLSPPLTITSDQADFAAGVLEEAMREEGATAGPVR